VRHTQHQFSQHAVQVIRVTMRTLRQRWRVDGSLQEIELRRESKTTLAACAEFKKSGTRYAYLELHRGRILKERPRNRRERPRLPSQANPAAKPSSQRQAAIHSVSQPSHRGELTRTRRAETQKVAADWSKRHGRATSSIECTACRWQFTKARTIQ
jgi:hypothetical protein